MPHGYLSEGEGALEDEVRGMSRSFNRLIQSCHDTNSLILQEGGDPEKQKTRQRMKAREWENELMSKGKVKVLEAVVRGCLWEGEQPSLDLLQPYTVCMLEPLPRDEPCTPEQDLSRQQRNEKREYSVCLTVLYFMEILYTVRFLICCQSCFPKHYSVLKG